MLRFNILAGILLISTLSAADTISDFKACANVLPKELLAKGYSRIGNVELEPFLERVERMNVMAAAEIRHKQDLEGLMPMERNLAEWKRTAAGDVSVSANRWDRTPVEARSLVALHESLGALGYSDNIFSCSGALYILANDDARATLNSDELARIEKTASNSCVIAGGTTGVTGGGDDFIARAKIKSIKNGLTAIKSGSDRTKATDDIESSLFVDFERNRHFKREDSIFSPNYKHTQECLDKSRGIADEATIRVAYNDQQVKHDARNGWTFDEATNCITFHGSAIHGWAGTSVLWSRRH